MMQNLQTIYGHKLAASDGAIGAVKDFYFDDQSWVVRYVVADTGSWLTGRLVLLSPHSLGRFDPVNKVLSVALTRQQIEASPSIDSHRPVSRQYEIDYYRYYGLPAYWDGAAMWGVGGYPVVLPPPPDDFEARGQTLHHHRADKHLQSTTAITGYTIQAIDGEIGRVSGLMVDDRSWAVHDVIVETGHWYAGKEILISPLQVTRISYEDSKVEVQLTRADIAHTARHEAVRASA